MPAWPIHVTADSITGFRFLNLLQFKAKALQLWASPLRINIPESYRLRE